ncbi:MAG: 3-isopropylmalate dehydratase small subunit [Neisseriaceae bacterium]|nr:3-isopropylmalate dehydratase small subunit [Neisseriaceae bacterium PsAf]MCV2503917.1 3-isopropylmalate dehydratase small subunit [Neisseriaceae bacterium]MCV2509245.1 3-isopropylmalate dehydratase small subunit [Neisseriaceae bacterium]
MKAFQELNGLVAPLDRANVDTDAIIPKQFLRSIKRTGYGENCFDAWRYLDRGDVGMDNSKRPLNPDFSLNQDRYQGAEILLTRKNFGCGSSREHAPWALDEYGFRAIIAPSFADIFFNNCYKNGLLPIVLSEEKVDTLFSEVENNIGYRLLISLPEQTVTTPSTPSGQVFNFDITEHRKYCLLNGLDEIGLTLQNSDEIKAFEDKRKQQFPWMF